MSVEKNLGRLRYTPHPPENWLQTPIRMPLLDAVQNTVSVKFAELLAMKRTAERLAVTIKDENPDLIPFFATGGIPFIFPATEFLSRDNQRELLLGGRFHMFPGLTWKPEIDGKRSAEYFAIEFGKLIASVAGKQETVRVWTFDSTFSGGAVINLVKAMYRAFELANIGAGRATVNVVAVLDGSRAARDPAKRDVKLGTSQGDFYLDRLPEFDKKDDLVEDKKCGFFREDANDLFDLNITYRVMPVIPTEDRAELIGAHMSAEFLGFEQVAVSGRLDVEFANKRNSVGTGGGSVGRRILNWLGNTDESEPWRTWLKMEELAEVTSEEKPDYELSHESAGHGQRYFELMLSGSTRAEVCDALEKQPSLLTGMEVHCLVKIARQEIEQCGKTISVTRKLLKKVLVSAEKDHEAVLEAFKLFGMCYGDEAQKDAQDAGEKAMLEWWAKQIRRNR